MTKRLPKRVLIFAAVALIAGLGSYGSGRIGLDPARSIINARCSSGAFITHAKPQTELEPDSQAAAKDNAVSVAEHDPSTTVSLPASAIGANLIANPGVETLAGGQPAGWSNSHFGDNDAAFSQVTGHNSGRAVRIDITKYSDGTANWSTQPVAVKPGGYYTYTDYYRANVPTPITVDLKDNQGKEQFYSLGVAPASLSWEQFSVRFFVPANASSVQITQALDRLGSVETDDYSLTEATPVGFNQPMVSVTFDDGWSSIHDTALPIMQRYDIVSTQYLVSGILGTKGYVKAGQVYDYVKAGHEVAAHTFDHKNLTKISDKELAGEVSLPKKGFSKCFGDSTDFAYPYGAYNVHTTSAVKGAYQTARSTDVGYNTADQFNPYELKVQNVTADTTPEQVQAWLDTAKANKVWLILVYHQVDNSHSEFSRSPAAFESDMQKVVASGIPVKTVHDAYAEISPQLKR
jgi:peptidoglycan/xylan/chitin deacetylase (PgdA/CDA1 family)